jgi:tRNA(Arg) A34 adenosine deaminase TadA
MAIEEAALGDYPFGTVIVRDGEVLARGHNAASRRRTRRLTAKWSRSAIS